MVNICVQVPYRRYTAYATMRIGRISAKRCMCVTLVCLFLLIFCLNAKNQLIPRPDEGLDQQKCQHSSGKAAFKTRRSLKPWYFKNGDLYPHKSNDGRLRPQPFVLKIRPDKMSGNDDIVNQLMYVPHDYDQIKASGQLKIILLYNGLRSWHVKKGRDVFLSDNCPVDTCEITDDRSMFSTADMILYKDYVEPSEMDTISPKQISMFFSMANYVPVPEAINWTASYRRGSTIVTPYLKWVYYDVDVQQKKQDRNYAANKTRKVAWFVSNCNAANGRLKYAYELQNYIEVDIYGACGKLKCSRFTPEECFKLLENDYKFYLAFENSNCMDYITEKYLVNGLDRGVLPIVMGARPGDYKKLAPRHSYIHVDEFASPKDLAEYLKVLDQNDDLYNSYFLWKGTGEFINTHFWCRVCAMLHNEEQLRKPHWYSDHNQWWRGLGVCSPGGTK